MSLYWDDIVIYGTDETSFQKNLDIFYEYAKIWKLSTNYGKLNFMIFDTRNDGRFNFARGVNKISIFMEFKYLGVVFH